MQSSNIKNNILIVGGTGFIGYHLIKYLKKKNCFNITSLSTKKPKQIRRINNVRYLNFDISKKKNFNFLDKNFKYVVNLGGYVNHSDKKLTYNSHFIGCRNLVEFFQSKEITAFIQIGSCLEYGKLKSPQLENKGEKPESIYSKSKLKATNLLIKKNKTINFPAIILRAYQIYGPRQDNNRLISSVIYSCLKNKIIKCSDGKQLRDFLFVDDFIDAIYKALTNKNAIGKIINIGYGKPIKVKKVILLIKKIIKKGLPKFNQIKLRPEESMVLFPSIKKAFKILKWKPKVKFIDGLNKTIKDYKKLKL